MGLPLLISPREPVILSVFAKLRTECSKLEQPSKIILVRKGITLSFSDTRCRRHRFD